MVRTRLRARQEAARLSLHQSQPNAEEVPDTSEPTREPDSPKWKEEEEEEDEGVSDQTTDSDHHQTEQSLPSVEELALKAVARVKERLSRRLGFPSSTKETRRDFDFNREEESEEEEEEMEGEKEGEERSTSKSGQQPNLLLLETVSATPQSIPRRKRPEDFSGELASTLQPEINSELYFSYDSKSIIQRAHSRLADEGEADGELMRKSVITADFEKREQAPPIHQSRYALQKMRKAQRETSAGSPWFNMPATQLTPELKNDLKILKLRNALDPTHHYRANDSKQPPKYFQIGRVISGPTEYYSSRIPRKQRKSTIVEELLADEQFRSYQKKKYRELQAKTMSGTRRLQHIKHKRKYKK